MAITSARPNTPKLTQYMGLAADVKPTTGASGSTFFETDTGALYVYTGAAWVVQLAATPAFYGQQRGYNGSAWVDLRTPTVFKPISLTAATAETTIWTPATGKKFRLMGGVVTVASASDMIFRDNTAGTIIMYLRSTGNGAVNLTGMGNGILSAVANNVLTVERGTSSTLIGTIWGTEE